jgi:DNA-binding helix-hairpin-helix protein with protein kinase domain
MAVLIFQLLFLGRHPFSGRNKLAADFDEETAIKKREFAYSLQNTKKKLQPPNDSFDIANLSDEVVGLFHRAFEQDARPLPQEWVRALDEQLKDMAVCGVSRLHSYPAKLQSCPWCFFQNQRGILYFLDDSYLKTASAFSDIDGFVQGFSVEKLELKKWEPAVNTATVQPSKIDKRFYSYRNYKWAAICLMVSFSIIAFTLRLYPILATVSVFMSFIVYIYSPWTLKLNAELKRLKTTRAQLWDRLQALIREYDHPADYGNYVKGLELLQRYVADFKRIPQEFARRRKLAEEHLYQEQLEGYLSAFRIEDHEIPSFGPAKKAQLQAGGIVTAADISKLNTVKVQGIGPKNFQVLQSWRLHVSTGFVYIPDHAKIALRAEGVTGDMTKIKQNLETLIRKEYQSLNYIRLHIANRAVILEQQIRETEMRAVQNETDLEEFRKLAA